MPSAIEDRNRRMLRARDAMDRRFSQPLDVPSLARVAHVSPAHFSRQFAATFGESPHRYLQRRRIERAMDLLRETHSSVTEVCFLVGFNSLGTFSRTFSAIVGSSPSAYRRDHRGERPPLSVPACWAMAWSRPADGVAPAREARPPAKTARSEKRRSGAHASFGACQTESATPSSSCSTKT